MATIMIKTFREGVRVQVQKDPFLTESLKQAFPRARWCNGAWAWDVSGRTAKDRVARWAATQKAELRISA